MAKRADKVTRFELDGEVFELNAETLTFGETEFVETYFDKPMEEVPWNSARAMLVIAALAKARKEPGLSLSAHMEALRDVQVGSMKESKPKRPTKTPETSGDQS